MWIKKFTDVNMMKKDIEIRTMKIEDYTEVMALWKSIKGFRIRAVDDDFEHIKKIISDSTNSKVIFICPQNYTFQYDFSSFDKFFNKSILLKDNILNIRNIIYNYEYIPNFLYAKTKTKILNIEEFKNLFYNLLDKD